jgi:hypothetical protein
VVIRDVFFGQVKECFNVSDPPKAGATTTIPGPNNAFPAAMVAPQGPPTGQPYHAYKPNGGAPAGQPYQAYKPNGGAPASQPPRNKPQRPQVTIPQQSQREPPPTDPRTQWEIDAETARLKQQAEAEAREHKRREREDEKRAKKLLETEQKEARRREAEVDKETQRLKKLYGKEEQQYYGARPPQPQPQHRHQQQSPRPNPPPRPNDPHRHSFHPQTQPSRPQMPAHHHQGYHQRFASSSHPKPAPQAPYLQVPGAHGRPSSVQFVGQRPASSMALLGPNSRPHQLKEKKSFFGFRKQSEESGKLSKKKSSLF